MTENERTIEGMQKTIFRLLDQIRGLDAVLACTMLVVAEQPSDLKKRLAEELESVKIRTPEYFIDYVDADFGISNDKSAFDLVHRFSRLLKGEDKL